MHCLFNQNNPSDNPLIVKISRPCSKDKYVMTYVPTMDTEALKSVIRETHLIHNHHTLLVDGVNYESFNMAKKDLQKFTTTGKLPEGAFITDESPLMVELFRLYEKRSKELAR